MEPVVATPTLPHRNISKSAAMPSSFTHFSPLTTRSRKITSPSSSFPYSPVSNGFSVSSSDLSDLTTPGSTPLLDRKRTVSSCQDSVSTSNMSRSSSTLSLCSNLSQVAPSLSPVERLLKHCQFLISVPWFQIKIVIFQCERNWWDICFLVGTRSADTWILLTDTGTSFLSTTWRLWF